MSRGAATRGRACGLRAAAAVANPRGGCAAATLLALALLAPAGALAQGAPADSLVRDYVRSMADSTDAYFGMSAQPADTAGLDSALVFGLAHPTLQRQQRARFTYGPEAGFNRVAGGLMGAGATLSRDRGGPSLKGTLAFANGPDEWFGSGELRVPMPRSGDDEYGGLRVRAGRRIDGLDPDHQDRVLASTYALLWGTDRQHYLRRDGAGIELRRAGGGWWAKASMRDDLESPMGTTATWTLFGATPVVIANRAAARGRAHEAALEFGTRVPRTPFLAELQWWNAGGALGGGFDYRRVRAAFGGGMTLGRHFVVAPMLEYGHLAGQAVPQAAFTLGGASTLRSLDAFELQGTGKVYGHVELMLEDPVQSVLGLSRTPTFPLQVAVFAGSGARWGYDPVSGEAIASTARWAGPPEWKSEVGGALIFRPGIPEPDWQLRLDWAQPVGQGSGDAKFALGYQRTLSVLSRMLY